MERCKKGLLRWQRVVKNVQVNELKKKNQLVKLQDLAVDQNFVEFSLILVSGAKCLVSFPLEVIERKLIGLTNHVFYSKNFIPF
jgi:hypothetical protein